MENKHLSLFSLVTSLSNTIDLISPVLDNHHKQVGIISYYLAKEMGLSLEKQKEVMLAGFLHDIGALSLKERLTALEFEDERTKDHMEKGYYLLKEFAPFAFIAEIVRFHHIAWNKGKGQEYKSYKVPLESHLVHLADRVAVLTKKNRSILNQTEKICKKITEYSGIMFMPELVEVFRGLAEKEYFWLDSISDTLPLEEENNSQIMELNDDNLFKLAQLYAKIIDFRSPFTANHSNGVAATAQILAALVGFSEEDCKLMKIAGYLHDLGKLAIPVEIINKPGKLTKEEYNLIRCHTYYTYKFLEPFSALTTVNKWASWHHEKLNGKGYPFHLQGDELPLGSKIMAVADVFTAITEDRPYRKGMGSNEAIGVLEQMVKNNELDFQLVQLVKENFRELNDSRITAQSISKEEYTQFKEAGQNQVYIN